MRVLPVKDESGLAVTAGPRDNGMAVDVTHDGSVAPAKRDAGGHGVVVMDRDPPSAHGAAARGPLARVEAVTGTGHRIP